MSDPESKSDVVFGLAEEFLEKHRRGERPSLREYVDRHPELADQIRKLFPVMAIMERIDLVDEFAAAEHPGARAPLAEVIPGMGQVGDFRIIREIGRGGMGVVYEAEQVSLGRHVALKVLPQQGLTGSSNLQRFRLEARAAVRLHHTNIVPVFGVGEQDGLHYYAMQFIPGQGLDVIFAKLRAGATPDRTITLSAIHDLQSGQSPVAEEPGGGVPAGGPSAATGPIVGSCTADTAGFVVPRTAMPEVPTSDSSDPLKASGNMALAAILSFDRAGGPPGRRRAGVCPLPGHPPPRHQAVELALRRQGHGLGDRLRAGQGRGKRRLDAYGRFGGDLAVHGAGAVRRLVRPA